eukprot:GHVT01091249.1.p1 GENE.GHVT01091249.1~~GHVT01091249.1.p1  ORF type:complete len:216 (+),score=59.92 GHVT01091249.1:1253-1900(+)
MNDALVTAVAPSNAEPTHWRLKAIAAHAVKLAIPALLNNAQAFKPWWNMLLPLFADPVRDVRTAAYDALLEIVKLKGIEAGANLAMPVAVAAAKHNACRIRCEAATLLARLALALQGDAQAARALKILLQLTEDRVPNVRHSAVCGLALAAGAAAPQAEKIKARLAILSSDDVDKDVREAAGALGRGAAPPQFAPFQPPRDVVEEFLRGGGRGAE